MPDSVNTYDAWQNFIEARRDETARAVSGNPRYEKLFNEFQEIITLLQSRVRGIAPGAVKDTGRDMEMLDRLRELNDELTGIIEERFYLAGLKDGVSIAQFLIIHESGNDGNDYLEECLDEHLTLAARIARGYAEGEGLKAS